MLVPFTDLVCPLDGAVLRLAEHGGAWVCSKGHSFDIAKQGYVNLLPVQHKRSKDPGDSKAMVAARREFLQCGFYQPIAKAISAVVRAEAAARVDAEPCFTVLDAGCGEGYYLRELLEDADIQRYPIAAVGLDISKWAVMAASKTLDDVRWIVGTNAHLPIADQSIDCVLCVFGFPVPSEFLRVLKPHGCLLMVEPDAGHLHELKNVIYADVNQESERILTLDGFIHKESSHVQYLAELPNNQQIQNLFSMTPHYYRASAEGKQRVAELASLKVQVAVGMHVFKGIETNGNPHE